MVNQIFDLVYYKFRFLFRSKNYSRIFTELGEAFLLKMVNETVPGNPHFSIQTLNLILICVGNHDYEVSK